MRKKNSQFDILLNTPIMFFTKNKMKDGIFMWNAIFEALYLCFMMVVCCKDSKRRHHLLSRVWLPYFLKRIFELPFATPTTTYFAKKYLHFLNSSKHEKAFVRSLFKLSQWEERTQFEQRASSYAKLLYRS